MELTDFTLDAYERLLETFETGQFQTVPVAAYLESPDRWDRCIVVRHDVDRRPTNALRMARLESNHDVRSTYYLREITFDPETAEELFSLGHEVGYHYETLARTSGDYAAALDRFVDQLEAFREVVPVRTVAAHGSPLSPVDNADIWRGTISPSDFGLLGEAYDLLEDAHGHAALPYFSDTGRTWDAGWEPADRESELDNDQIPTDEGGASATTQGGPGNSVAHVESTEDLVTVLRRGVVDRCCLLAHPSRWSRSGVGHVRSMAWDLGAESAKRLVEPAFVAHRGLHSTGTTLRQAAIGGAVTPFRVLGFDSPEREK